MYLRLLTGKFIKVGLSLIIVGFMFGTANIVQAANITADGTTCTLTDAILSANSNSSVGGCTAGSGADTITLDYDVSLLTADQTNSTAFKNNYAGLPDINGDVTIVAGGGNVIERDNSLACSGTDNTTNFRLFNVLSTGDLTLDGITVRNECASGLSGSQGGAGGGIYLDVGTPNLVLTGVTLEDCSATSTTSGGSGGGILAWGGTATILKSMIRNNLAASFGGGIFSSSDNGLVITDSIISGNQSGGGFAGGIHS